MTPFKPTSILTAAFLTFALPAEAHVGLERGEAPRGTSYKAVIKVPHGCEGSSTHTVRIEIPDGYIGVKPMPKPDWTLKTVRGPYAEAYAFYHGKSLTEGVKEIEWSGGDLPDEHFDEFVANGYLAKELAPGATLYFKVVQVCPKGELRWVEVPAAGVDPHSLDAPAAVLKIAAEAKSAASAGGKETAGSVKSGALSIEDAWTRATAEGAKVGAGYLTIRNTGSMADTLVSIETPVAGRGEIHEMTMTDGVMRMRRMPNGIETPAGGRAELKPGGTHLMLIDLKQPLVEGGRVPVKLTFKSGAVGEIELPVRALGAGGDSGAKKGDDDHSGHSPP